MEFFSAFLLISLGLIWLAGLFVAPYLILEVFVDAPFKQAAVGVVLFFWITLFAAWVVTDLSEDDEYYVPSPAECEAVLE